MRLLSLLTRTKHYFLLYKFLGFSFIWSALLRRKSAQTFRFRGRDFRLRPADSDAQVVLQIFSRADYDLSHLPGWKSMSDVYASCLNNGQVPIILDLGANIGVSALYFHEIFDRAAVVSIEPDPGNFELLEYNVAQIPQVKPIKAAIGSREGYVEIVGDTQSWGVSTQRSAAGCPVLTIDAIRGMYPTGRLFIAKIDIEGFEDDLFSENVGWVDEVEVIIIEPHDWLFPGRGSSHNFQKVLGDRGFDLFIRGENLVYIRSH